MTHITPYQAKTLLDDAERTGRWYADYDDEADATRLYDRDEDKDEDEEITDGGSWTLAAAAPDLARTVIAHAEYIAKLEHAVATAAAVLDPDAGTSWESDQ